MKRWVSATAFLLIGFFLFLFLTKALLNKSILTQEGISGYYCEEKDSLDFVFFGNSVTYTAINPAVLWEDYGITSYNFAVSEQIIPISYYYIEEALKTQHPKAVVLNVTSGANYLELRDSMLHVNLDYLPWSMTKINAIRNVVPRDKWSEFFLPIIRMHGNWQNFNENSIRYMQIQKTVGDNKGYVFVNPFSNEIIGTPFYEVSFDMKENIEEYCYDETLEDGVLSWYQKIIDLTSEKGVDLILIGIPSGGSPEYQGYFNPIFKYAMERKVTCINYNLQMTGVNHNPADNAEIFTRLLGRDLTNMYEIKERDKSDPKYEEWNRAVLAYEQEWNAARLNNTFDQEEWFHIGNNENYTIFFAVDTDSLAQQQLLSRLSGLGAGELEQYKGKVSCVVSQGKAEYYPNLEERIYVEYEGEVVRMSIDDDSITEIKFKNETVEGKNCSVMIYDNILHRVVDKANISGDYAELTRESP